MTMDAVKAIKEKQKAAHYKDHPEHDQDITALLSVIDTLTTENGFLKKKSEVLLQQNMELSEEMENVRSDFGDTNR